MVYFRSAGPRPPALPPDANLRDRKTTADVPGKQCAPGRAVCREEALALIGDDARASAALQGCR